MINKFFRDPDNTFIHLLDLVKHLKLINKISDLTTLHTHGKERTSAVLQDRFSNQMVHQPIHQLKIKNGVMRILNIF